MEMTLREQRDILAAGIRALRMLDRHSLHAGGPLFDPSYCPGCSKYGAALLRGHQPAEVRPLACGSAQGWMAEIDAALELTDALSMNQVFELPEEDD